VGTGTSDDAAVWRLDADRALVVTADFITPIVDDPRAWGRIAAANAVSDVYAMGGRPILGLNLVGWNTDELGTDILLEVLLGAGEAAKEGGWITVGGHTVDDPEPKFGMAMVGEVHPDRILTNAGLRPGDALVLTKALGVGIIATAMKAGKAPEDVIEAAVASMTLLNREAGGGTPTAGDPNNTNAPKRPPPSPRGPPAPPTSPASASSATCGAWPKPRASTPSCGPAPCRCCPVSPPWSPRGWCPAAAAATWTGPASGWRSTAWTPRPSSSWPTPKPRAACCSAPSRPGPTRPSPPSGPRATPQR
jgi:hypothetical protein